MIEWTEDRRWNAVRFKDGKMAWQSTRYKDRKPLTGHAKAYDVK